MKQEFAGKEIGMQNQYVVTRERGIQLIKEAAEDEIIREVSSREELEELIERIPYTRTIQAPNGRIRKELYQEAMGKYDDLEWVKIIKSVHLRVEDRNYEPYEPEFLEKAQQYLYGELAVVFEIPFHQVEAYLNETITRQLEEF